MANTISDYDKEEIKRQFSISTSLIPLEYEGDDDGPMKINILDTPGYFDFVEGSRRRPSARCRRSDHRSKLQGRYRGLVQRKHGNYARSTVCRS